MVISREVLACAVATLFLGVAALVISSGPSPELVAVFHGSTLGLMLLVLPLSGALRGRARATLLGGIGAALLYLLITSVPLVSIDVVPWLPTERLIEGLGEQAVVGGEAAPNHVEGRVAHWTAGELGRWGRYEEPGRRAMLLSPRRVAFQRVGHDLAAIVVGLIGAMLVALLIKERPGRYDSAHLPADQGRGSPEALRRLLERTQGRGGQAPSTRA